MTKEELIKTLIANNDFKKVTKNCLVYHDMRDYISVMFHDDNQVTIFNDGNEVMSGLVTFTVFKKSGWDTIYQEILVRF